ncbi:MAG: hypothetical protein ABL894_05210 [Hyphomicrobium sp.]
MSVCPSRETLAIIDGWLLTHNVFAVTLAISAALLILVFLFGKIKFRSFWHLCISAPVVLVLFEAECSSHIYRATLLNREIGGFVSTFLLFPAIYIFPMVFISHAYLVTTGWKGELRKSDFLWLVLLIATWLFTRMTLTMDG